MIKFGYFAEWRHEKEMLSIWIRARELETTLCKQLKNNRCPSKIFAKYHHEISESLNIQPFNLLNPKELKQNYTKHVSLLNASDE